MGSGDGGKGAEGDARTTPPRAVDLRRGRQPEIEILAAAAFDFLLSIHVCVASPELDYTDYDIGRDWIVAARARCAARDPGALELLDRTFGGVVPGALHATLIALVALVPAPRDSGDLLDWLAAAPPEQVVEALLDQEGLGDDWRDLLRVALGRGRGVRDARTRLAARYTPGVQPTVTALLADAGGARRDLVGALRVWDEVVFVPERERVLPLVEREAAMLARQRSELSHDRFLRLAMRGVEWERPASALRKVIFAPSYFSRPAVFYHFWHGTLTFCLPVEAAIVAAEQGARDPRAPAEETLRFFEALGDDTRLRILRLLAEREMYLTELAERLGLTKATTKHHMVRLRAAGFVTLYDRDRMTFYALRPGIPRMAARLIDDYLRGARLPSGE
ncbi:MAG TPA: winged helix-turn-helix domain-containing protein [Ktedonobacterales bacterium]